MSTKTFVKPITKPKLDKPKQYKVLLHNDDFTPMEFVVSILMTIFQKSETQATDLMIHVHKNGMGVCGVYSYAIAESKITQAHDMGQEKGYPLMCTMDEA